VLDLHQPPPLELESVRQQVTNVVASHAIEVVYETIEHIKDGNYQAMKYLFEMVGLFPAGVSAETGGQEDSLAKILLRHLGTVEAPAPRTPGAQVATGLKTTVDAVK
jgi:hypothetical protein